MSDFTVARRYARALYEEAEQHGRLEQVDEDVSLIRQSLDESGELVRFFESPVISREKKEAVVQQLFAERVQPVTLHFLKLLIEKKREMLFPTVVRTYASLRDEQLGIIEAHARTAQPLDDAERDELAGQIEAMTGQQVRLDVTVDPDLLGGLIVRVGDTVYDGSVRHKLEQLRERMEVGVHLNGT